MVKAEVTMSNISKEDILLVQKQWSDGLVAIGRAYTHDEDYLMIAKTLLDNLYGYHINDGKVLFKPTKAAQVPFRGTYESALSYFIGNNEQFPEDRGFALAPWINIEFHNHDIYYHGDLVIAMGYYLFTSAANEVTKVEYTFGYIKDDQDQLKIIVHHSSLPFSIDA